MNGMHGIIFSYEKRNDLRELGEIRSASSIPFGGRYRAVDFALSNLVNAGVTDVGVVLHGRYQSLLDHLGTGKDWDLSRKRGGLKILPPFAYKQSWGEAAAFRGKMEALAGVRSYLEEIRRDYVVLMDGDLVVNLPLSEIRLPGIHNVENYMAAIAAVDGLVKQVSALAQKYAATLTDLDAEIARAHSIASFRSNCSDPKPSALLFRRPAHAGPPLAL